MSTKNAKVLKVLMSKTSSDIINENLKTIEEWAIQGLTEKEIAECLNIGYSTFRREKTQNLALLALLKHCAMVKRNTDKEQLKGVEKSLYERARGYDEEKTIYFKVKRKGTDANGNRYEEEEVVSRKIVEHVPADIQAAKFFLINKNKKKWQNDPNKVDNDKETLVLRKKIVEKDTWS